MDNELLVVRRRLDHTQDQLPVHRNIQMLQKYSFISF